MGRLIRFLAHSSGCVPWKGNHVGLGNHFEICGEICDAGVSLPLPIPLYFHSLSYPPLALAPLQLRSTLGSVPITVCLQLNVLSGETGKKSLSTSIDSTCLVAEFILAEKGLCCTVI